MTHETFIGIGASILTASSLLPQLVKLIKEKKSNELSFIMLGVLFGGLALWIYYGVLKKDLIIILSNAFALFINLWVVILTLKYRTS